MNKKTVFLTGATGNMGWAGFKELHARKDRFDIRLQEACTLYVR